MPLLLPSLYLNVPLAHDTNDYFCLIGIRKSYRRLIKELIGSPYRIYFECASLSRRSYIDRSMFHNQLQIFNSGILEASRLRISVT